MTIEEAFEKEEEDRSYRNFCDEEVYSPTVTVLEDEDKPQKGSAKHSFTGALFGNSGNNGNMGKPTKDKPFFGGRYDLWGFKRNLIAEAEPRMLV